MRRLLAAALLAFCFAGTGAHAQTPSTCPGSASVRTISANTYQLTTADNCWWIYFTFGGPVTVTLPTPNLFFGPTYGATIVPSTSTTVLLSVKSDPSTQIQGFVNGNTTLPLSGGQGAELRIGVGPNWTAAAFGAPGQNGVAGPATSSPQDLASYVDTTGKVIQDSGILSTNVQTITGLASPAAIGNITPNSGAFTTLSATGAVSGAGFTALFASPPALGGTAPAGVAATTLSASGAVTGAGITALFASPPAIGGSAAAAGTFNALTDTGLSGGGTLCVHVNNAGVLAAASGDCATGGSGSVTSIATTAPISGGTITTSGTLSLTGPSNLTTFTSNAIPKGAGASAFTASSLVDNGTTVTTAEQIVSTLASGTAPLVVASTTQVANLNASTLGGATFAAPGTIGGTTPSGATFTSLTDSGTLAVTGTVSGTGFSNYLASPPAIGGTAPAAVAGTSFEARTGAYLADIPNAGTTGTTQFLLAKLTGAGTAVLATTSDTGGVVLGSVQSASATTGNAQIGIGGQVTCTFDGATTQDDFVQVSTTAGGDCHDTGSASFPTSGGQVLGRVLSTHGAGGNYLMVAFPPAIVPGSGGGAASFTVMTKTGSYTLNTTTDVGVHLDNNGASGTVPITLPAGTNGLNYCFMNLVSGQTITVTAPGGIKISVGETQSGAAGILTLPNFGDGQCLEFLQSQWFAFNGAGSWTLQ